MKYVVIVAALALAGCMTQVDREALSFPDMPKMPVYVRVDARPLSSDEAMSALRVATRTCQTQAAGGMDSPRAVGTPDFDACMQTQGYRRTR